MLDWLETLSPAELSKQAAAYATLAADAALTSTRAAFARLADECENLAVERTNHAARQGRNGGGSSSRA